MREVQRIEPRGVRPHPAEHGPPTIHRLQTLLRDFHLQAKG